MKKPVTKEMVEKWLNKQIAAEKSRAVEFALNDKTNLGICGVSYGELHVYKASNVKKLAEFLELPYEVHDPWHDSYPDHVEVSFNYNGWRIFGIDVKEEYTSNEKAEVTD